MNDESARGLLRPLHDTEPPPSTIDIQDLVGAGRRRVRVRTMAGGAAVAVLVLAAVPVTLAAVRDPANSPEITAATGSPSVAATRKAAPPAPTSCTVARLPLPDGATDSQVVGGDPTGRYLVGAARAGDRAWTLLWDRGRLAVLDPPTTDPMSLVVNANGVVAGDGLAVRGGRTEAVAWVYRDGRYTTLSGAGSGRSVVAINGRGDILGTGGAMKSGESTRSSGPPMVWPAGAPNNPRPLAVPPGDLVTVGGIDDDGTVVGAVQTGVFASKPGGAAPEVSSRALVWSPRIRLADNAVERR